LVIIICSDTCNDCNEHFLKNPDCLGDYTADGVLLRYCPKCGNMYPYLNITYIEKTDISNRVKKRTGTRIASEQKLDFKIMAFLVKTTQETDKDNFALHLSEKIKSTFNLNMKKEDVLKAI
jgi:hypothetical protein